MKANGKTKQPRTPVFVIDGQEFTILCGHFGCDGHQAALELGENPERVCKRALNFTGQTAPVLMAGTASTLNGICPILLIEEED